MPRFFLINFNYLPRFLLQNFFVFWIFKIQILIAGFISLHPEIRLDVLNLELEKPKIPTSQNYFTKIPQIPATTLKTHNSNLLLGLYLLHISSVQGHLFRMVMVHHADDSKDCTNTSHNAANPHHCNCNVPP